MYKPAFSNPQCFKTSDNSNQNSFPFPQSMADSNVTPSFTVNLSISQTNNAFPLETQKIGIPLLSELRGVHQDIPN